MSPAMSATAALFDMFCRLNGLTDMPRPIIMGELMSYGAAKQEMLPGMEPRQHRYLNTCAEHSH